AIVNSKTPSSVLDADDGKAIVNRFIGSDSQLWEVSKVIDLLWSIRNLSSGHYLGMKAYDKVTDWYELREVEHPFLWHLRRFDQDPRISIFVPYTNFVIDLHQNPNPGTVLYIHGHHQGPNQKWHFCKDLHLAASKVLRHDAAYRIINIQAKTAIQMNQGKVGCFRLDEESDCQKFIAVETENGWAFRNIESQDYLGIPNTIVSFQNAGRLSCVRKKFTWVVLPHHENAFWFKIWVPFTSRVMDLHRGFAQNDTPIHLLNEHNVDCQWWRFEPVNVAHPGDDAHIEDLPEATEPRP
ncbi:hypothetical protein BKA70DRAFT_1307550, partial [Coprinopsis sp. MPI-PUGE-AT-0042]